MAVSDSRLSLLGSIKPLGGLFLESGVAGGGWQGLSMQSVSPVVCRAGS